MNSGVVKCHVRLELRLVRDEYGKVQEFWRKLVNKLCTRHVVSKFPNNMHSHLQPVVQET